MIIKKRTCILILSLLLVVAISSTLNVLSFSNEGALQGSFTTDNVPPPAFINISVQDSATTWDNTSLDTHDITPNIMWINLTDDNSDILSSHVCIANATIYIAEFITNNVSTNCSFATKVASGTFTISDVTGLKFTSTNTTYYITIRPDDGAVNGTELNGTLNFLDSRPYVSNLNITETHSQNPIVQWSVEDNDTGGVDQWPADTLTHYLWIGNNSNTSAYYTNLTANNDTQWIATLPWGEVGEDWANRTINITIGADDGWFNSSSNYTTSFRLYDYLPHINSVQMVDVDNFAQPCQDGSFCALTPVEHDNTTVAVRLNVTDTDNDCLASNHDAWIMLCLNTTGFQNCDEVNGYNYSWKIDSIETGSFSDCIFTFSANKTAADKTPEFFRTPGNYLLHLNVTSQAGERTNRENANATWQFGTLKAIDYSWNVTLGDGTPTLDQWNDGTNLYTATNWGNDVMALRWNASDPTNGVTTWTLNGTDFAIDDDNQVSTDATNLQMVYLNATDKNFTHINGLERCVAWDCNDADTNETLATYYHIYPPLGLSAGTYNTSITLTLLTK